MSESCSLGSVLFGFSLQEVMAFPSKFTNMDMSEHRSNSTSEMYPLRVMRAKHCEAAFLPLILKVQFCASPACVCMCYHATCIELLPADDGCPLVLLFLNRVSLSLRRFMAVQACIVRGVQDEPRGRGTQTAGDTGRSLRGVPAPGFW